MGKKPRNLSRSLFREHPAPRVLLPYTNHLCVYSYLVATNCNTFSPTYIVTTYKIGHQGRTWDQGSPSPKTGQHHVLTRDKRKRKEGMTSHWCISQWSKKLQITLLPCIKWHGSVYLVVLGPSGWIGDLTSKPALLPQFGDYDNRTCKDHGTKTFFWSPSLI